MPSSQHDDFLAKEIHLEDGSIVTKTSSNTLVIENPSDHGFRMMLRPDTSPIFNLLAPSFGLTSSNQPITIDSPVSKIVLQDGSKLDYTNGKFTHHIADDKGVPFAMNLRGTSPLVQQHTRAFGLEKNAQPIFTAESTTKPEKDAQKVIGSPSSAAIATSHIVGNRTPHEKQHSTGASQSTEEQHIKGASQLTKEQHIKGASQLTKEQHIKGASQPTKEQHKKGTSQSTEKYDKKKVRTDNGQGTVIQGVKELTVSLFDRLARGHKTGEGELSKHSPPGQKRNPPKSK